MIARATKTIRIHPGTGYDAIATRKPAFMTETIQLNPIRIKALKGSQKDKMIPAKTAAIVPFRIG
jgi:hypothetical protein